MKIKFYCIIFHYITTPYFYYCNYKDQVICIYVQIVYNKIVLHYIYIYYDITKYIIYKHVQLIGTDDLFANLVSYQIDIPNFSRLLALYLDMLDSLHGRHSDHVSS